MHSAKTIRLSSLGLKFLAAYVVGAVTCIAFAVLAAVWVVEHDMLADLELRERITALTKRIKFDLDGKPLELNVSKGNLDWIYDSLPQEAAYRILDTAGNVMLVSKAGNEFWPQNLSASPLKSSDFFFERDGVMVLGTTEVFEHQGRTWYLQFATSERVMKLILHKFALPYMGIGIGVFSAVLIIVFGLSAYTALRHALAPLRGISEAAAAISPRSLHARLQTEAVPTEISPLVDSFNRVLERLERGYQLQQEFLANAAHELKTPLALIRAQIELPVDEISTRDSLLSDVDYMTRQVQQLLHLTEASELNNYDFAAVSVQDQVKEVISYLKRMAGAADVQISIDGAEDEIVWEADRGALFTLLKNLLENAIQHAPTKSIVSVDIQSETVTVRDLGPGVDVMHIPMIFTRFWRGEHRRDHGAGLGLAICQEIALAHGWRLTAEMANPGLRFRLTIEDKRETKNT